MSKDHYLFRTVDVWKRLDSGGAVCYRCFELLPSGSFCVQSADYYDNGEVAEATQKFSKQYLELFLEEYPNIRSEVFDSLEEAIYRFDADFSDED